MQRRGVAAAVAATSVLLVVAVVTVGYRPDAAAGLVQPDGSRESMVQLLAAPRALYAPTTLPRVLPRVAPDPPSQDAPAARPDPDGPDGAAAAVSAERRAFEARFPAQAAARPGEDERWALLIGINRHLGAVADNHASRQDAERLHRLLRTSGWSEDRIVLLTDTDATGAMIREGLAWLARNSADDATVVFHYSGHSKKTYGPGRRIVDQALWPTDDDFVWRTELATALGAVEHDALWGNVAACEAAGFHLDGVAGDGRVWTYSSAADQKSYEDPSHGLSVWGRFLVHEQLGRPRAPSVQEAFASAASHAADYTALQVPYGPQRPELHDDLGRPFELEPVAAQR